MTLRWAALLGAFCAATLATPVMAASEGVLWVSPASPPPRPAPFVIDIPRSQLTDIARINPMAAMALLTISHGLDSNFNLLAGGLRYDRVPTFETVVLSAQGAADQAVLDSHIPVPEGKGLVEIEWKGVRTELGLKMSLSCHYVDPANPAAVGAEVYPAIVATLRAGHPGLISGWERP